MQLSDYILLDRRFARLVANDPISESAMANGLWASPLGNRLGDEWNTLMARHRYAVILGEARSGKTYELAAQAKALRGHQRFGFYATLRDIKEQGISAALGSDGQVQDFERWRTSTDEATFFLDSVDEARALADVRLGQTVRHLRQELGDAFPRARLMLSCRVSDWRPRYDIQELQEALGFNERVQRDNSQKQENSIGIYQLIALDYNQIRIIVDHELNGDEQDIDLLMNEFSSAQLWIFAGRPADLKWLISYWKQKRKFGSFRQIVEENIEQKIREDNPDYRDKNSLSTKRIKDAVQQLAAALLLGRKSAIAVKGSVTAGKGTPDEEPGLIKAVNPETVLDDFRPTEIDDLLSRPLFDEATYGRVRFHHRTIMEYLAADWLLALHQRGCPTSQLLKVLFSTVDGQYVLPRSRAAIAAWLAPHISEVHQRLLESAPEALLCEADSTQWTEIELEQALRRCAVRLRDRKKAYTLLEEGDSALFRLAAVPIEAVVYELLDKYRDSSDMSVFLLKLISIAKWKSRCELVGDLAVSSGTEDRIRIQAMDTLAQLQDPIQINRMVELGRVIFPASGEVCAHLIRYFYPTALTVIDCLVLLKNRYRVMSKSTIEWIFGYQLPDTCLPADRFTLLSGLLDFSFTIMYEQQNFKLSEAFTWLYRAISKLTEELIGSAREDSGIFSAVELAFALLEHGASNDRFFDYKEVVKSLKTHRQFARELVLRLYRIKPTWLFIGQGFPYMHAKLFTFETQDIPWLLEQATQEPDVLNKRFSLFTAIYIWQRSDLEQGVIEKLENLALEDPFTNEVIINTKFAKSNKAKQEEEDRARETLSREQSVKQAARQASREARLREQEQTALKGVHEVLLGAGEAETLLLSILNHRVDKLDKEILTELLTNYRVDVFKVVSDLADRAFASTDSTGLAEFSYLAYLPNRLRQQFATLMLEKLIAQEPKRAGILTDVFRILCSSKEAINDPRLIALAPARTKTGTDQHRLQWLVFWLHLEADTAWIFIEGLLSKLSLPEQFATDLAAALHQQRIFSSEASDLTVKPFWKSPKLLGSMARALYKYLPRESVDTEEADTGIRRSRTISDAGEFRDSLTSRLWKMESEDAYHVLKDMTIDPALLAYRNYFLRLCDLALSDIAEASHSAWPENEIYKFSTRYTAYPRTAIELFELVQSHLEDIQLRTERSADFSISTTLNRFKLETELQNWLAGELDKRRPSFYRVIREGEVADSMNPDILIVSDQCVDRIAIELKPTARPNHSYNYFEEKALKEQLIGKYLRTVNAKFGILVLIHTEKRRWRKSDGLMINSFNELLRELNQEARRCAGSRVCVFGIDCT